MRRSDTWVGPLRKTVAEAIASTYRDEVFPHREVRMR